VHPHHNLDLASFTVGSIMSQYLAGWPDMILKQLTVIICLLVLSLQFSWPVVGCVENCHSQIQSCHGAILSEVASPVCPHSKTPSSFVTVATPRCACTIQAHETRQRTVFALSSLRTEISSPSLAEFEPTSQPRPSLVGVRPHRPPLSLALAGQNTFLIESSLRI
jgi:hypothetical protein